MLLNSGVFVFVMVRYAGRWLSAGQRGRVVLFLAVVFSANAALMASRYELAEALTRAGNITLGFLACTGIVAWAHRRSGRD